MCTCSCIERLAALEDRVVKIEEQHQKLVTEVNGAVSVGTQTAVKVMEMLLEQYKDATFSAIDERISTVKHTT